MERTVNIGGKDVRMRASALIPRLYRFKFGRDMIADMNRLVRAYKKATDLPEDASDDDREAAQLSAMDLTIFENVAYMMIKHAGEDVPDTPDQWLDSIDGVFSVYEIMPTILELWQYNQGTTSTPKKKENRQRASRTAQ